MLADKYLNKTEFGSYEDFLKNYKINAPENFNFGYDIVDVYAKEEPDKKRLYGVTTTAKRKLLHSRTYQNTAIKLRIFLSKRE